MFSSARDNLALNMMNAPFTRADSTREGATAHAGGAHHSGRSALPSSILISLSPPPPPPLSLLTISNNWICLGP